MIKAIKLNCDGMRVVAHLPILRLAAPHPSAADAALLAPSQLPRRREHLLRRTAEQIKRRRLWC
jgi:hypothetical protein